MFSVHRSYWMHYQTSYTSWIFAGMAEQNFPTFEPSLNFARSECRDQLTSETINDNVEAVGGTYYQESLALGDCLVPVHLSWRRRLGSDEYSLTTVDHCHNTQLLL